MIRNKSIREVFAEMPAEVNIAKARRYNEYRASYIASRRYRPRNKSYIEHLQSRVENSTYMKWLLTHLRLDDLKTVDQIGAILDHIPSFAAAYKKVGGKFLAAKYAIDPEFNLKEAFFKKFKTAGLNRDEVICAWNDLLHAKIGDKTGTVKGNSELLEVLCFQGVYFNTEAHGDLIVELEGESKSIEVKGQGGRMTGQNCGMDLASATIVANKWRTDYNLKEIPNPLMSAKSIHELNNYIDKYCVGDERQYMLDCWTDIYNAWCPALSRDDAKRCAQIALSEALSMPNTYKMPQYVYKTIRANKKKGIQRREYGVLVWKEFNVPLHEIWGRPFLNMMLAIQTWQYQKDEKFDILKIFDDGQYLIFNMGGVGDGVEGIQHIHNMFQDKIRCLAGPAKGARSEGCQIDLMTDANISDENLYSIIQQQ